MRFSTLFFDLDDTLYPAESGLWSAIRDRMGLYMVERLKIPESQVPGLRRTYYETYGTTLRGLQHHHEVDEGEYLAYVHDLPLPKFLTPDPGLRALLARLPQAKWIFTNADRAHAERVIQTLGLEGLFNGIIDVTATGYACKPEVAAYQQALALAGEVDPGRCIFLDDSPRNLAPARALGMVTVLVGSAARDPAASYSLRHLHDLPAILPELWAGG